ncbi:MAG: glutathione gamma-glutamylcysteinyltransferase [Moorea sp. SIO3G5]|nr:glutathione gamma-glutamylcysteinyltransferase [Moorena sp. SIO3G5]
MINHNYAQKSAQKSLLKLFRIPLQVTLIGFFLINGGCLGGCLAQTIPLTENLINLDSDHGEQLLMASQAREDYLPLSIQFVTQENLAYCGVASMVMVLNALSIQAPEAPEFRTNRFTQKNVFNAKTEQVRMAEVIARRGMTLEQLAGLLETYPVRTEVYHGGDLTLDQFRNIVVKNLQEAENFVLVNYLRKAIAQKTGGHISPLAAYNHEADRFLILDVSRYKYPPVWVKAEELWQAMATKDSESKKTRGFVLVSPR